MDSDLKSDFDDSVNELQSAIGNTIVLNGKEYTVLVSELKTQDSNHSGGFLEEPAFKVIVRLAELESYRPAIGETITYENKAYRIIGITIGFVTLELELQTIHK